MSFSNSKIKQVVVITITLIFSYWLIGYSLPVQAYFEDSFIDQMMNNYVDSYVDQMVEQMENQAVDRAIDTMVSGMEDRAVDEAINLMISGTKEQPERYYYWVQKPKGELKKIKAIKSNTEEKAEAYAKKKGWSFLTGQYGSYPEKPAVSQNQSTGFQTQRYYYWVQKPKGELKKIKAIKSNTEEKAKAYAKKKGWSFLTGQYGSYPEKPAAKEEIENASCSECDWKSKTVAERKKFTTLNNPKPMEIPKPVIPEFKPIKIPNICVNCLGTDTSCGCLSCTDCNKSDGWVNIGKPYHSDLGPGGFYSNQNQEYRDYFCSGTLCKYKVTKTRTNRKWIKESFPPLYPGMGLPKNFGQIEPFF